MTAGRDGRDKFQVWMRMEMRMSMKMSEKIEMRMRPKKRVKMKTTFKMMLPAIAGARDLCDPNVPASACEYRTCKTLTRTQTQTSQNINKHRAVRIKENANFLFSSNLRTLVVQRKIPILNSSK